MEIPVILCIIIVIAGSTGDINALSSTFRAGTVNIARIRTNADNFVEGNETLTISVISVSLNQQNGSTEPVDVIIQDINGNCVHSLVGTRPDH